MEFDPTAFWLKADRDATQQRIVAQENLLRLHPDIFKEVVFLPEYFLPDDAA